MNVTDNLAKADFAVIAAKLPWYSLLLIDQPITCPQCGARTNFGDLPGLDWQYHCCLNCEYEFIACE